MSKELKNSTVICTNCGDQKTQDQMQYCRMDGCTEDWNSRISALGQQKVAEIITSGQRVFVDSHAPLCYRCATQSGYVCWHCDLRRTEAGHA